MKPNNLHDPYWQPQVTVPVRRVGAAWEFFYGGDVPVKQGTLGELRIMKAAITDETFRHLLTRETLVKVMAEGATLYAALSDRSKRGEQIERDRWPKVRPQDVPLGTTRFAAVTIGASKVSPIIPRGKTDELVGPPAPGGLWLRMRGLEKSEIHCSTVNLPEGLSQPVAVSLNHAFTELSKHFERHRISNTGNVYTRFFYPEASGTWYPLEDLRNGVRARVERSVLQDAWAKIEAEMGWCRLPEEHQPRKGRSSRGQASDGDLFDE